MSAVFDVVFGHVVGSHRRVVLQFVQRSTGRLVADPLRQQRTRYHADGRNQQADQLRRHAFLAHQLLLFRDQDLPPGDAIMILPLDIHGHSDESSALKIANERIAGLVSANLPYRERVTFGTETIDFLVSATWDHQKRYIGPMLTWEVRVMCWPAFLASPNSVKYRAANVSVSGCTCRLPGPPAKQKK